MQIDLFELLKSIVQTKNEQRVCMKQGTMYMTFSKGGHMPQVPPASDAYVHTAIGYIYNQTQNLNLNMRT